MFRRITNIELLNKITELENKIDIMNSNLNLNDNLTLQGCCNCKLKELTVYKELKDYFETKFEHISQSLKEITNETNQDCDIIKINESKINYILRDHKRDIINSFDSIIETLKGDSLMNINKEEIKFNQITNGIIQANKTINIVLEQLKEIYTKIDLLYYENETIKHQLMLEEEIRKYEFEIANLKKIINETIKSIESIELGKNEKK